MKDQERVTTEERDQVSRRSFLKKGALVGMGAASLSFLAACSPNQGGEKTEGGSSSSITWDYSADVVVVGSGSGLFAAIEAADAGASVILLEKGSALGGCFTVNGGWYNGAGTQAQERQGIADSGEAYWKQWQMLYSAFPQWTPIANHEIIKLWIDTSGAVIDRLEEHGLEFVVIQEPNVMEVPRGHIIQPDVSAYVRTLEPVAESLGVEIMKDTPGVELIVQSDKTILGVKAEESSGKTINIQANKGVILASGDTSGNKEFLLKNYVESLASIPACWPLNTADGIRMAMAVGADSSQKSLLTAPVLVEPHSSNVDSVILAKGMIYVDSTAKRFCNELDNTAPVLLNARDDKTVHILFSKDVADFTHRPAVVSDIAPDFFAGKSNFIGPVFGGWGFGYLEDYLEGKAPIVQADTIEELAAQLDLNPAELRATVDTWNNSVAAGEDSEFSRPLGVTGRPGINDQFGATVAMLNPPYYALTSNKPALMCTEGPSLIIDQNMAVLDVYGNPIPKLYACGSGMTGGFPIIHLQHGEHAGFSLTSAYIAARAVTSA